MLNATTFRFLNKTHDFEGSIDWNYSAFGKLWNYNLQYFDYALSKDVSTELIQTVCEDFDSAFLEGAIEPEAYPISVRIVNRLLFYSVSGIMTDLMRDALCAQISYLHDNIEYHIDGNHLLENRIALTIAALYTDSHTTEMFDLLDEELNRQILGDGAHYERSPMYQSILLARLLIIVCLTEKNLTGVPTSYERIKIKCKQMAGWLQSFCFRDGSFAMMQDSAPGIAANANMLTEMTAKYSGAIPNVVLKESGYRKFVQGDAEFIIDVGAIGPAHQPGHAHAGIFSFCWQYRNKAIITDTGITTYEANEQRLYERSTRAHNTVTVEDEDQSEMWSAFRVGRRASVVSAEEHHLNSITGKHNGYRNKTGADHERNFRLSAGCLRITDRFTGVVRQATARIHFGDEISVRLHDNHITTEDALFRIVFTGAKHIQLEACLIGDGFNRHKKGCVALINFTDTLTTEILFA